MIKNSQNDLYIGISENQEQRLKIHNSKQGAKFTKRDAKFKIVFNEEYSTMSKARKREIQIKKWNRKKKEMLIERFTQGLSTKLSSAGASSA